MSLPNTPSVRTEIVPSYLYFQYALDEDLQALVTSYNENAQLVLDWFQWLIPPYYPPVSGTFILDGKEYNYLDWVIEGIYGYKRPNVSAIELVPIKGPTASHMIAELAIAEFVGQSEDNYVYCPDDIYKRCLTWNLYKADGFTFSTTWLKRRIYRFLYGVDGTDVQIGYTPKVSVDFRDVPNYWRNIGPTGTYVLSNITTATFSRQQYTGTKPFRQDIYITLLDITDEERYAAEFFISAMNNGALYVPMEFNFVVNPI